MELLTKCGKPQRMDQKIPWKTLALKFVTLVFFYNIPTLHLYLFVQILLPDSVCDMWYNALSVTESISTSALQLNVLHLDIAECNKEEEQE